jgi:hypothetical protein
LGWNSGDNSGHHPMLDIIKIWCVEVYEGSRLKGFRKHRHDVGSLENIYRNIRRQSLIVAIPTYDASAHGTDEKPESGSAHSGAPTAIRPEVRPITCCTVGIIETLAHSRLLLE